MTVTASQFYSISPSDVEIAGVDYTDVLSTTETVSGPSVAEITTTDLTLSNVGVNTAVTEIFGREVAVGKGVLFRVSGQVLTRSYRVRVNVTTSSTPTRSLYRDVTFDCQ